MRTVAALDTRACPDDANEMVSLAIADELEARGHPSLMELPLRLILKLEAWAREAIWNSDATLQEAARLAVRAHEDEIRAVRLQWSTGLA